MGLRPPGGWPKITSIWSIIFGEKWLTPGHQSYTSTVPHLRTQVQLNQQYLNQFLNHGYKAGQVEGKYPSSQVHRIDCLR